MLKALFSRNKVNIKYTLYALLQVGLVFAFFYIFRDAVKDRFEAALDNLEGAQNVIGTSKSMADIYCGGPPCPAALQLLELNYFIGYRSGYYVEIASKYFYNYQACTMMLIVCSIGLGICTFIIAKKGWDNQQNHYLKISFVICFFFSTLFGLFVTSLKLDENFRANISK
jgi:hypothetical protein